MCTVRTPAAAAPPRGRSFKPRLETSLDMTRLVDCGGGESQVKHRSASRILACPNPAALRLDDRAADRQADAHALRLGGHERLEQTVRNRWRETAARVADANLDHAAGPGSAGDDQFAAGAIGHGLDR